MNQPLLPSEGKDNKAKDAVAGTSYKVLFHEDATVDDFIHVIEGNRRYIKCIYVYNKIDVIGIDVMSSSSAVLPFAVISS